MIRTVLTMFCLISALTSAAQSQITLGNDRMEATVNIDDAAMTALRSKQTGWNVLDANIQPHSFEASIKLADGSFHFINGSSQPKPEVSSSRDSITFTWNTLLVNGQKIDIRFEGTIKIDDDGISYSGKIDNKSDAVLEELSWPNIGGITLPENSQKLLFQYLDYTKFTTHELYPGNPGRGWSTLPVHAFTLIHDNCQGLYISSLDHQMEEVMRCQYEIVPKVDFAEFAGGAETKNAERDHMATLIKAVRMLFVQPGDSTKLVPVLFTTYKGDWHAGVDNYKKWRASWYVRPHRADWLNHVNTWQQLQILSSESRCNFKIKDLGKYVDEARRNGVNAIQLTGWTKGGQDRGLPVHDLDPRLGTREEFKKEIANAKKKGVNILLFTKFTWADLTTSYHDKWQHGLAWHNGGDTCIHPGYNYNTYTQLSGISTRRFGIFCMIDDSLRTALCNEFQKCLDLGAAGMVYDENQHHAGTILCFNPNHGHKIPGFVYKGADLLGHDFQEMCKKTNPDFLMTGEGCYDQQSKYYTTYTRADYNHVPVLRYIDSEMPIACAIIDHYDLDNINMCLATRYAISYEVRNFKGHLEEFPRVMKYGRKVDQLRKKYADYLWDAEFLDTKGAKISGGGNDLRYTVFQSNKNGKKAVVIYNVSHTDEHTVSVELATGHNSLAVVTPEKNSPTNYSGCATIKPHSVLVILEQ